MRLTEATSLPHPLRCILVATIAKVAVTRSEAMRSNFGEKAALSFVIVSLAGCSFASYPTKSQVEYTAMNTPRLETIADGRSYLTAVRNDMVAEREKLQILDYGLDAGIVGGVVTTALGTALKWGSHTNITAGILSAAVIGVDSVLSLKTQEQIINRGLDALICVESQAEAAYVPVKQIDAALAPVAGGIRNLQSEIDFLLGRPENESVLSAISLANVDLVNAKSWLSVESVPVANVVVTVKIGVDSVLQTTVDQLNSALPDGSAFAKIALPATPSPAPPPSVTPPKPALTPNNAAQIAAASVPGALSTTTDAANILLNLVNTLHNEIAAANAILPSLTPVSSTIQLSTINCPVASGTAMQALQISPASLTVSLPAGSTASVNITGGTPQYKAEITTAANATGLTPQAIRVVITGSTVTLTNSTALNPGTYNLVVTDSTGAQRTAVVIAK